MPRRDLWVAAITIGVGLAIIVVLVISGISQPQPSGENPLAGQLIVVPTAPPRIPDENGLIVCNAALLRGVLVAHREWGITVRGEAGEPPLVYWPHGYVGRIAGDRIELLDDQGRVVARTGDSINAGGGGTTIDGVEGFGVCPGTVEVQPVGPQAE